MPDHFPNDPHRPAYHFLPERNWMNDPNGLIQWRGNYHLFYQHNPNGAFWGDMHWGHAVSSDLVHWKHLPMALAPTPGGPDKDGVFSGCAVDHDGVPTLVYTGTQPEVQCIATGSEDLLTWAKDPGNPVIPAPPEGLEVTGFRDPCVWREDDVWYMVVGSGIKDKGGTALLYRSPDLRAWEYIQPILVGDKDETGEMWECPYLFPLGGKHVLLVSVHATVLYFIGTYRDYVFTPESQGNTDFGGHFYAAQGLLDDQGRRLLYGWIWEGRSGEAQKAAGWAGVQSLPRVLTVREDGRFGMVPAGEYSMLRDGHWHWAGVAVNPGAAWTPEDALGDCLEVRAHLVPSVDGNVALGVRRSPGGEEETLIRYDASAKALSVDRARSSLSDTQSKDVRTAPLTLDPDGTLDLHVFVDRSVIEVFANGHCCLTTRVYPEGADATGVAVTAEGSPAAIRELDVWSLKSIWGGGEAGDGS